MSATLTPAQAPVYTIPPPQTPFVDDKGMITRVWWRYLSSLFISAGSGGATMSLAQLQALVTALQQAEALLYMPHGQDLHNAATIAQARQFASWGM